MTPSIFVLGEALMDCMAQPDGQLRPLMGGSPFSMARAAALRGASVAYLNPLSVDIFGQGMARQLERDGVQLLGGTSRLPTSLARRWVGITPKVSAPAALAARATSPINPTSPAPYTSRHPALAMADPVAWAACLWAGLVPIRAPQNTQRDREMALEGGSWGDIWEKSFKSGCVGEDIGDCGRRKVGPR